MTTRPIDYAKHWFAAFSSIALTAVLAWTLFVSTAVAPFSGNPAGAQAIVIDGGVAVARAVASVLVP